MERKRKESHQNQSSGRGISRNIVTQGNSLRVGEKDRKRNKQRKRERERKEV